MLEWLERAESGRVFLDDGARRLTYGETAEKIRGLRPVGPLRPETTIDGVLEVLTAASRGTAVLVGPGQPDPPPATGRDPGFLVFTSGTSGTAKPVYLSWGNWTAAAAASMAHLDHDLDDVWLLAMPLHHVAGLGIVLRSAFAGGSVRLLDRFEPAGYAAALRQVTMASVVPTMLKRVLDTDPEPYSGLRAVLVGGGPIPEGLLERAAAVGIPALPTYGMTETCGQVATLKPGSPVSRRAHPLPGVEIRVDDGRIALKGGMISDAVTDDDGWLVTGDLGELDDEGAVRILGRADDMIISGGENVSPAAVESALAALPGVDSVVVLGVPSESWGSQVAAVYVGSAAPESLKSADLPSYAVPKRVVKVDAIPLTSLGKPDRGAIESLFRG
jgi:O-succinylbenzoic acid--CoA ligase